MIFATFPDGLLTQIWQLAERPARSLWLGPRLRVFRPVIDDITSTVKGMI